MELRYGNKSASIAHHIGPWDWTEDETVVTINDIEGFTAVETVPGSKKWQVYLDNDEDGLSRYVPKGRQKLRIKLERTLMVGGGT